MQRHADGREYAFPEDKDLFWQNVGVMAATFAPATTDDAGRFDGRIFVRSCHVMAMDGERKRGGLAMLSYDNEEQPLEIVLTPLVRVRGRFVLPGGKTPSWTHVFVEVPGDPKRPLAFPRLVGCGSKEARFEFSLPPGRYLLGGNDNGSNHCLIPRREIELSSNQPKVDLGAIELSPHVSFNQRKQNAQDAGEWRDSSDLFGKPCPHWHAVAARGIDADVQPADLRGKWVLLDFWGLECAPCLATGIPRLARFYEEHAAERDRFEIISICMSIEGEVQNMAELDRQLEPIVKHVWKGKQIPFPVLLDPTFNTWSRFGLRGMGQTMLIDPEGNLLEGDEEELAKRLKQRGDQE